MILPTLTGRLTDAVIFPGSEPMLGAESVGQGNPTSAVWPSQNLAIAVPFTVQQRLTAYSVYYEQGSATSGNLDIGIYSEAWARLISTGTTAQGTANTAHTIDITDTVLTPGRYYLAMACDNITGAFLKWAANANLLDALGVKQMATAFVLPDPITPATMAQAYVPMFGLVTRSEAAA